MVASTFRTARRFEQAYHWTNGTIQPTSPSSAFQRGIPIKPIQTRSGYCWQLINLATTTKRVISHSAQTAIYTLPPGIAFAIQLWKPGNMHKTLHPCLERFCGSMSTGRQISEKPI